MDDGYSLDGAVKKKEKSIRLIEETLATLKQPSNQNKDKQAIRYERHRNSKIEI